MRLLPDSRQLIVCLMDGVVDLVAARGEAGGLPVEPHQLRQVAPKVSVGALDVAPDMALKGLGVVEHRVRVWRRGMKWGEGGAWGRQRLTARWWRAAGRLRMLLPSERWDGAGAVRSQCRRWVSDCMCSSAGHGTRGCPRCAAWPSLCRHPRPGYPTRSAGTSSSPPPSPGAAPRRASQSGHPRGATCAHRPMVSLPPTAGGPECVAAGTCAQRNSGHGESGHRPFAAYIQTH